MDNQNYEPKQEQVQPPETFPERKKNPINVQKCLLPGVIIAVLISALIFMGPSVLGGQRNKDETITVLTLEKIIDISEFNTFQAIYNGIAVVMNDAKPDQLDYHVSYQAKIKAGFDFKKIAYRADKEAKKLFVEIPEITINDTIVDIGSLDYMFLNEKANKSGVSAQAYRACILDAEQESKEQSAIYELAEQNAINVMKALISPFLDRMDETYELEFIVGGAS